MKLIDKALIFAAILLAMAFVATSLSAHELPDHSLEHADRAELQAVLWNCSYSPHPISDATWEMYRQGMIPIGTATYYTKLMQSKNLAAGICLREVLPEHWEGRDTRWIAPDDG